MFVVECPSAESEGVRFCSWWGLKIFPLSYARHKIVKLLSFPFPFLITICHSVQETLPKILWNKNSWSFFFVTLAASFPNIIDPWWNKCWQFNLPCDLRRATDKVKNQRTECGCGFCKGEAAAGKLSYRIYSIKRCVAYQILCHSSAVFTRGRRSFKIQSLFCKQ